MRREHHQQALVLAKLAPPLTKDVDERGERAADDVGRLVSTITSSLSDRADS